MNGPAHDPMEDDVRREDARADDPRTARSPDASHRDSREKVDEAIAEFAQGQSDAGNPNPSASPNREAERRIETLTAALQEAQERALRAQADLENYRKRVRREIEDERRFAAMPLLRDLLPVIDNLHRAIQAVGPDDAAAGLLEGVQMVEQQLQGVLQAHDCHIIQAEGTPFDPTWHEAIAEQPSADHPRGTVLQVAQTGYRLHDRVVRPSQVIVSKDVSS